MLAWMDLGWQGWVLPTLLTGVWVALWRFRRLAMVWFFTAALAVSALSCPAGFLIGMFDSAECPQNTESARVVQGHDLWNSFCPSKYAMVVWTNTFWSVVVCAVLGVITLAVITVRAIVLRTRRSGPQESAGVYQGS